MKVALNISDDGRANVLRQQHFGDFSQCQMRLGSDDVSALGRKNARNRYLCLPGNVLRSFFDRLCFGCPQATANYYRRMHSFSSLRKSALAPILLAKRRPGFRLT
jgi:hypothetical protein